MLAIAHSRFAFGAWLAVLAAIVGSSSLAAQEVSGTWTLISETVQRGDQVTQPLGAHPLGMMMLDQTGHFSLIISREGLPKIAANRRDAGTPEENHAILGGMLAFYGSYKASVPDGLLMVHVEASTFPNWIGTDQRRDFKLSGDEMTWVNRAPAVKGETAKLVWRRSSPQ
jgi:hypothetical protein